MVSNRLDRIAQQVERLSPHLPDGGQWDGEALGLLNGQLRELMVGIGEQVQQWIWELDARDELQGRLLHTPPPTEKTATLWWREQVDFYAAFTAQVDAYFGQGDEAAVTFSLTALEVLFFVRVLIEEGAVQTDTLRPVFRYLSRYGRTGKQRQLSYESLKKRYSLQHEGAQRKVRQLLVNLIKRIDQHLADDG